MIEVHCCICGETKMLTKQYAENFKTCSKECNEKYRELKKEENKNVECVVCHTKFHLKQSRLNKIKNPCCSRECSSKLKKTKMLGSIWFNWWTKQ